MEFSQKRPLISTKSSFKTCSLPQVIEQHMLLFLLLFTLSEALKVFSQQRWRHCLVALRHVRFHGGSSERPERPAASPRLPASVHPLGIVRLGIGEHLVGPHQASSRAVVLSSDVPLPSCHLDYRGRRTPSGFSPTFTRSWHLTEAGFEPGTID